jgi:hypothetical protein
MSNGIIAQAEQVHLAMEGVNEAYLLLVQVDEQKRANPRALSEAISTIHEEYMERFRHISFTIFDMAFFSGLYDFAVLYVGTTESSLYLVNKIHSELGGGVKTWCLPGMSLGLYQGMHR